MIPACTQACNTQYRVKQQYTWYDTDVILRSSCMPAAVLVPDTAVLSCDKSSSTSSNGRSTLSLSDKCGRTTAVLLLYHTRTTALQPVAARATPTTRFPRKSHAITSRHVSSYCMISHATPYLLEQDQRHRHQVDAD